MKPLENIYNPFSDTFLILYQDAAKGYGVTRRVRSEQSSHLGLQWFGDSKSDAIRSFEDRLVREAGASLFSLAWRASVNRPMGFYNLASSYESGRIELAERDAQQYRVYEAEQFSVPRRQDHMLSREGAEELCGDISREYGIRKPGLWFHKKPAGFLWNRLIGADPAAIYLSFLHQIHFYQDFNVTRKICCHEMAHAVTDHYVPKATPHGPYFARISTQIYVRHAGADPEYLVNIYNRRALYGPRPLSVDEVMSPLIPQKNQENFKPDFR